MKTKLSLTLAVTLYVCWCGTSFAGAPPNLLFKKATPYCYSRYPVLGDDGKLFITGGSCSDWQKSGPMAVDPKNGTIIWGPSINHPKCSWGLGVGSVSRSGLILCVGDWNECGDGILTAYDVNDGSIAWSRGTSGGSSPHPRQIPAINDEMNTTYFGSSSLFSVDINSGANHWIRSGGYYEGAGGMAIDSAGNIYYGSHVDSVGGRIRSYTSSGVFRWSRDFSGGGHGAARIKAVLNDDVILVWHKGVNAILALDGKNNGSTLWQVPDFFDPVVDVLGQIVGSTTTNQEIICVNSFGNELWRIAVPGQIKPHIDFADDSGRVYARAGHILYAINVSDGSMAWSFEADAMIEVGAVLVPGGHIFFVDKNGMFYSLNTNLEYAQSSWPISQFGNRRHTQKAGDILPLPAPPNKPPIADAGLDQEIVKIGTTVRLDGTRSVDPEGDPITYNWSMVTKPEGSITEISDPVSPNPTFQADCHGDYVMALVVSDTFLTSEPDQVTIRFKNIRPVAKAKANPATAVQGETVCFDGNDSEDGNHDPLVFSWRLTASPLGSKADMDDPGSITPCITTDFAGNYGVNLVVNDGLEDSEPTAVSVFATSYLDAAKLTIKEMIEVINRLNSDVFKNKNMQKTLINKVNAVLEQVQQGTYAAAIDKLRNDLLGKTDGCATSGNPDKNDWIEDCPSQGQVYPLIIEVIGYLEKI